MVNKSEIIEKFKKFEGDTGSPEVQCALWTDHIKNLTAHIKSNPSDFQSLRGLLFMVKRRKRILAYLKRKSLERFNVLVKELGIRV
jgi:small subunit ribosomal protein S15